MKKPKIFFVIHPTDHNDFDILAIGDKEMLKELAKENKYYHYINSFPLVVLDTCDKVSDAVKIIKELKNDKKRSNKTNR